MLLSSLHTKLKSVGKIFDKIDSALYPIIGLPNYENYVKHFRENHPDKEPLSRSEFFRESQDRKSKNVKC